MNISLLLYLLLSDSNKLRIGSALASLFGWVLLIVLFILIWEYKIYVFLFLLSLILTTYTFVKINEYLKKKEDDIKYKDETPEEREERLKIDKITEEWRKRNNF